MLTSDTPAPSLGLRRTDTVRAVDAVRHVDELEEPALDRFLAAVDAGGTVPTVDGPSFDGGEVVVYTDYYRVELG